MLPAVLPGDRFLADKAVNRPGAKRQLRRGDIVVFVNPNDRTQTFVKRLVGLPGDRIVMQGSSITVNEQKLSGAAVNDLGSGELNRLLSDHVAIQEHTEAHDYVVLWSKDMRAESVSFTVANGQVFVLGDNRNGAMDSRTFGGVPLSDVIGRAEQVTYSLGESGMRWERLGASLTQAR